VHRALCMLASHLDHEGPSVGVAVHYQMRVGAGAIIGLVFILVGGVANADCHQGTSSGSGTTYAGPSAGSGYASRGYSSWNKSGAQFYVKASRYAQPYGSCETAWFDWGTGSGHFDARAARNCNDGWSARESVPGGSESTTGGRTLLGMQKMGACYAPENSYGTCNTNSLSISGCTLATVNSSFPNNSTRAWVIHGNGTWDFYSGGTVSSSST
jgi:hypothetical protein